MGWCMGMGKASFLAPLGIFLLLVFILALGFGLKDPHDLPSVLIDRPFPEFDLPKLKDASVRVNQDQLKGEVSLVNVWATWCPACAVEHPQLLTIARNKEVRLIGVNYKDDGNKALNWLQIRQDPYEFNIVDADGKLGINLGVYGAPETFVVDANGVIQYRHTGAVTAENWEATLKPLIQQLRTSAGGVK